MIVDDTTSDNTTSDAGISAMVDIAGTSGQHLTPGQTAELDILLAQGLIEEDCPGRSPGTGPVCADPQGPESARRTRASASTSPDRSGSNRRAWRRRRYGLSSVGLPTHLHSPRLRTSAVADRLGDSWGRLMSSIRSSHFQLGVMFATTLSLSVLLWPVAAQAYTADEQQACSGDAFRLCSAEIPDVERVHGLHGQKQIPAQPRLPGLFQARCRRGAACRRPAAQHPAVGASWQAAQKTREEASLVFVLTRFLHANRYPPRSKTL